MLDLGLRLPNNPAHALKITDVKDFIAESKRENGKVLALMNLPLEDTALNFSDPGGFESVYFYYFEFLTDQSSTEV